MSDTLSLAEALIARPSITPEDAGCQTLIATRLQHLGFITLALPAGPVSNLWAVLGDTGPLLAFAGHTDVVPTGPLEAWRTDPFSPSTHNGYLFGRGAQDMKGNLAAMITATERYLKTHGTPSGVRLGFMITSAEEGDACEQGTPTILQHLKAHDIAITWCVVGEPSSSKRVGDRIRHGRRGSLTGKLHIQGQQGHVAYADEAENPIHAALPALQAICTTRWDEGTDDFPPTSLQVSNIHAGTGASNVIPDDLSALFNLRYNTTHTAESLKQQINQELTRHNLTFHIDWHHSGSPFLTKDSALVTATCDAIFDVTGETTRCSTAGGTSDGRYIAPTGAAVIEFGCCNDRIHQINERVGIAELDTCSAIYQAIIERFVHASSAKE